MVAALGTEDPTIAAEVVISVAALSALKRWKVSLLVDAIYLLFVLGGISWIG